MKKTFLFIPGAWMGAWVWEDLKTRLTALGHQGHAITLKGLEDAEKVNSTAEIDLEAHVTQVVQYIQENDLKQLFLVGHSYSGIVAGMVADKLPQHIQALVFMEAFLPEAGKSLLDVAGLDVEAELEGIEESRGIWPPPTQEELACQPEMTSELLAYLTDRFVGHPGKTVISPAEISSELKSMPSYYIGGFLPERIISNAHFSIQHFYKVAGGHWSFLIKAEEIAKILDQL